MEISELVKYEVLVEYDIQWCPSAAHQISSRCDKTRGCIGISFITESRPVCVQLNHGHSVPKSISQPWCYSSDRCSAVLGTVLTRHPHNRTIEIR
eukprot:scaffold23790_cov166-Cylindrotheca_fusiformis.AAC.3